MSNWTWDPVAKAYYWHRFYACQPDLNFDNPLVVREVKDILNFWLDLGVDGFRLDAVPYLVEREGTNGENLRETHNVLKIDPRRGRAPPPGLRAAGRGQPAGRGRRCAISAAATSATWRSTFPLMPRLFMSLAQEDSAPIVDIVEQTRDLPEGCQWALFLRNHDELTLEMVTEDERDYLWQIYATHRRQRINLGIRRRLATLLNGDRRRIELLYSLLFSLNGTPVVYYGDEIGMGDNPFLGDRDGVRTPMQWSADRNAGFSRADACRAVPAADRRPAVRLRGGQCRITAQLRASLLNWTRWMIRARSQHPAFGRGEITFLAPDNHQMLAYLRHDEAEMILCVANLCETAQAVELDLADLAGQVPVEMFGGAVFPAIGERPGP